MGTRSLSTEIPGIKELTAQAEQRIVNGQKAIGVLEQLRKDPANEQLREQFLAVRDDLGFGLLLKRYTNDVNAATPEMIKQAAADTIPSVTPMFWSFRIMVGSGLAMASSSSSASSIPSGMKSREGLVPAPRRAGPAASLDRQRSRLVRRRIRPPALDHLQRPSDASLRLRSHRG